MITQVWRWFAAKFASLSEFQHRVWIVSVDNDSFTDTFVINEGSFEKPMQWMVGKGYSTEMLQQVDALRRSQVIRLELGEIRHQLLRVK